MIRNKADRIAFIRSNPVDLWEQNMPGDIKAIELWSGKKIAPGDRHDVTLAIGESYSSSTVKIPLHIRRAINQGPVVFITAALHGDEINGTGAIRQLIQADDFKLESGTLILVPVLNLLAFDRHSRYLPDRRDLNRSFPGSQSGSLASRMARKIFDAIVAVSDFGIDLHTAAVRRTNYPNVRGDLTMPNVCKMAEAFGCDVVINGKGPKGSLRREACEAGCPTIIMEGGEVWKVEPGIVETAERGIKNVLRHLGMLKGTIEIPNYQITVEKSKWIRAEKGGFLKFHISPGDVVEKGQALATNTTLLGRDQSSLSAPFNSVVLGMTTLPAVSPGEPVCHLGKLPKGIKPSNLKRQRESKHGLEGRVSEALASNLLVEEPE